MVMATTETYKEQIQQFNSADIKRLWTGILNNDTPGWEKGKAFEFLILRAFELEGATVRWPYSVSLFGEKAEEIDGVIHLEKQNLSIVIECKDSPGKLNIEPIAKLRNQLLRRPSNAIGAIFTTGAFSPAASALAQFLAPQTILLWEAGDVDYCIENGNFIDRMLFKYRLTIEEGQDPSLKSF